MNSPSQIPQRCHDCAVEPGSPHTDGCDVARCGECGWQRISCEHGNRDIGWGQVWTGLWPGDEEVNEGLASDLNDLASKGRQGLVKWNGQRWVTAELVGDEHA